jgi:hypothetical protein
VVADTTSLDARFASIADRLDEALGHLREAESGVEDPATLHHLDMVGLAISLRLRPRIRARVRIMSGAAPNRLPQRGDLDRERLAKLLGMLGSAHDGEVAAAGRAADAMVRGAGLTWHEVIRPALPKPPSLPAGDAAMIEFCIDWPEALAEWEWDFVWSLRSQNYPLRPKQRDVLNRLVDKVRRAAARAA